MHEYSWINVHINYFNELIIHENFMNFGWWNAMKYSQLIKGLFVHLVFLVWNAHEIFIIVGVKNRTYWYYSDANTAVIDS